MYGSTIGTLELSAYENVPISTTQITTDSSTISQDITTSISIVKSKELIWSKTGRQKNEWLFANVTLPIGNYKVIRFINISDILKTLIFIAFRNEKLEFAANRSIAGRLSSDIALDDFSIQGNECKHLIPLNCNLKLTNF